MKKLHKNKRMLFILLLTVCVLLAAIIVPINTSIVFYKQRSNEIEAYLPVKRLQHFEIIFTHSIHLTDVIEKYRVTENNRIMQYEMVYEEFGIGMPSNANTGETFVYEKGKYHIKDLKNIFLSMNIRNGETVSKHRLLWEDTNGESHMVYFNDYFEPGAWFNVKVKKLSLLQTWIGVKIHD